MRFFLCFVKLPYCFKFIQIHFLISVLSILSMAVDLCGDMFCWWQICGAASDETPRGQCSWLFNDPHWPVHSRNWEQSLYNQMDTKKGCHVSLSLSQEAKGLCGRRHHCLGKRERGSFWSREHCARGHFFCRECKCQDDRGQGWIWLNNAEQFPKSRPKIDGPWISLIWISHRCHLHKIHVSLDKPARLIDLFGRIYCWHLMTIFHRHESVLSHQRFPWHKFSLPPKPSQQNAKWKKGDVQNEQHRRPCQGRELQQSFHQSAKVCTGPGMHKYKYKIRYYKMIHGITMGITRYYKHVVLRNHKTTHPRRPETSLLNPGDQAQGAGGVRSCLDNAQGGEQWLQDTSKAQPGWSTSRATKECSERLGRY